VQEVGDDNVAATRVTALAAEEPVSSRCSDAVSATPLVRDVDTVVIGAGQAGLSAAFDNGVFVVGGGVSDAGDLLLEPARDAFRRTLTGRGFRSEARIVRAHLGNEAGMVGAADLARARRRRRSRSRSSRRSRSTDAMPMGYSLLSGRRTPT